MKIIPLKDCVQGSEKWEAIRRGRPTASRFSDIITPAKGEYSKGAKKYMRELIADCFTTDLPPAFTGNRWTDRGTENEGPARIAFQAHTGLDVQQVGFVLHDNGFVGCSPDSLIYDAVTWEPVAGLEIKCPSPATHVETVLDGEMPAEHKPQVHGSMYITGLDEWHFWSFCPGMKPFHQIIYRDEYTAKVGAAVEQFIIEFAPYRAEAISRLKIN